MKKLLTTFILLFGITISGWAQIDCQGNLPAPAKTLNSVPFKLNILNTKNHDNTRFTGSRWYSYLSTVANFIYGTQIPDANFYPSFLFPDSSISVKFSNGIGTPFIHNLGTILDPTSTLFNDPSFYGGMLDVTKNDPYVVDSVQFVYGYGRANPDTSIVDTLELTVFSGTLNTHNIFDIFYTGENTNYGYDTVNISTFLYDYTVNEPILGAPTVHVKLPLTNSSLSDTVAGGSHVTSIVTSALGTIPAGSLVGVVANFIPGYKYNLTDTLNTEENYLIFSSFDENGAGNYPIYTPGDFNQSYVITNETRYNTSPPGGYDSLYIPTVAFTNAWTYDDHNFSFHISSCQTCFGVGVKNVEPAADVQQQLYPNPTNSNVLVRYNLANASNVTVEVKDLSGRTVFSKILGTQNSGIQQQLIDVSNYASGIYFVSLKTNDGVYNKKFIVNK